MVNALFVACLLLPQEPASPAPVPKAPDADEGAYVQIVDVPLPEHVALEVGGMVQRGKDLFVCTRRGEVWRITGGETEAPKCSLWAEGLQEPLGLLDHDGWLYCAQRGELSRMRDRDGGGRMDELETVAAGWPLSGNYHEYCFGPTRAKDGSFWLTLNKPFGDEPFGHADWRGFAIRIPADGADRRTRYGQFEPVCAGLRSPAGIGTAPDGTIFYTDNQGEWCATSKFAALEVGDFHGHPWGIESCKLPQSKVAFPGEVKDGQRIDEAARTIPGFRLPAVWIPYDLLGRSPAGFVWDTAGNFGPFRGQVFCGDQYSSEVFRMSLERVGGRWQGACYPFRRGLKSGITRLSWGSPGSLWCGLTNRGWGSNGTAEYGLQRLVWKGPVPFDLLEVTALSDGFRLRFTLPVDRASVSPAAMHVRSWTYDLHEEYGCPPRDTRSHVVAAVDVSADGTVLDVRLPDLEPCRVYELRCDAVSSQQGGDLPWHGIAWYTRNAAPAEPR
ncbi:MAG: auracyanin family protein [Planctomycetota bacterium]